MARKLLPWQEAIGKVKGLREESGRAILTLENIGDIAIDTGNKSVISKLKGMIGRKVAILHTDMPRREYVLRKLT